MKVIEQQGPFYAGYYLLECVEDYEVAILHYLKLHGHEPERFGLQYFTLEDLVQNHRVKGNRHSLEHTYPQVLTINFVDEPDQLVVNFIPKTWFEA